MREKPLISIVTPCYNSKKYIEKCILSIKNQTYSNVEHIIVDGGSTDGTLDVLKNYENTYNMRWISEKDDGMYDAISKGFSYAKGDIFAWLNSDDMYMPWALEMVAIVFTKNNIEWCVGTPCAYSEDGISYSVPCVTPVYPRWMIKKGYFDGRIAGFIQQESSFWSRSLWMKNKDVIGKYKYAGDYHLWRAFSETQNLYTLDSVISGFRIHPGQKSENIDAYYKEVGELSQWGKVLKKTKIVKIVWKIISVSRSKLLIRGADFFGK